MVNDNSVIVCFVYIEVSGRIHLVGKTQQNAAAVRLQLRSLRSSNGCTSNAITSAIGVLLRAVDRLRMGEGHTDCNRLRKSARALDRKFGDAPLFADGTVGPTHAVTVAARWNLTAGNSSSDVLSGELFNPAHLQKSFFQY